MSFENFNFQIFDEDQPTVPLTPAEEEGAKLVAAQQAEAEKAEQEGAAA